MRTSIVRRALVCALAVLPGLEAHAQIPEPTLAQLVHRAWTPRDGVPSDVVALAQTADGVLWLGTASGLHRFDGTRFERFEPATGAAMPGQGINSLLALPDGRLVVGYLMGGVSVVTGGHVVSYGEQEGMLPGVVTSLARDSSGVMWAATSRGIARLVHDRWRPVGAEAGFPGGMTTELMVDRRGALWATNDSGVYLLPRSAARFVRRAPPLAMGEHEAGSGSVREAPDGTVWAASLRGGLVPLADSSGRPPPPGAGGFDARGWRALYIDRQGNAWALAMEGRLVRVPLGAARGQRGRMAVDSTWMRPMSRADGMSGSLVYSVLEDHEGSVWIGTNAGLDQLRSPKFRFIRWPAPAGLVSIAAGDRGALWAGSTLQPLARVADQRVSRSLISAGVTAAHRDLEGGVWLAGMSGLWHAPRGGAFTRIDEPREAAGGFAQSIVRDRTGDLWLSVSRRGMFRRRGGRWHRFDAPAPFAIAMASDSAGHTWLGYTANRLARVRGDSVHVFTAADGLGIGAVLSLYVRGARVWIGGELGFALLDASRDGARVVPLRVEGGVRGVSGIVETLEGDLWLSGADGVVHVVGLEVARARDDTTYAARVMRFGVHDGIEAPTLTTVTPSVVEGTDGRLWFTTSEGVASVDPRRLVRNRVPPLVQVSWLESGGERYSTAGRTVLPPRTRALTIGYTALSLAVPERVRFRYRLVGNDPGWQDAGTRREAVYTNLGPGAYTFRVIAANDDGIWNETGASIALEIPPTFVQTRLFVAFCALTVAVALWWLARWRHQQAAEGLRGRFAATFAERTRIAQEFHDTLLQGFTGIAMQLHALRATMRARPEDAAETVTRLAAAAEAALREARRAVWEMRAPELDELDLPDALAAAAYDVIGAAPMHFELAIRGQRRRLAREIEVTALRIGREAVANAVRHAGAGAVHVSLDFGPRTLALAVRDDGYGLTMHDATAARREGHWGLVGMRERAERAGGSLQITSAPGSGTVVSLDLPNGEVARASHSA